MARREQLEPAALVCGSSPGAGAPGAHPLVRALSGARAHHRSRHGGPRDAGRCRRPYSGKPAQWSSV